MGNVIAFANQKGGVGKTTTTVTLGSYIAAMGKKVLLVDFDPQGNLSSSLAIRNKDVGVYEVITKTAMITDAIVSTHEENLFLLSSNTNLAGAPIELIEEKEREYFLKNEIQKVKEQYDYIFIDCPPSLDLLTVNGLVASDYVFVPLQCEYFALEGLTLLIKTINSVKKALNPNLEIGGIILTMYDSRTNLANDVAKEAVKYFKEKVFRTIIPRNVHLGEAPSHGLTIQHYKPGSSGAKAYEKLTQEVIARV
jgi:chromosome partitioning protein